MFKNKKINIFEYGHNFIKKGKIYLKLYLLNYFYIHIKYVLKLKIFFNLFYIKKYNNHLLNIFFKYFSILNIFLYIFFHIKNFY